MLLLCKPYNVIKRVMLTMTSNRDLNEDPKLNCEFEDLGSGAGECSAQAQEVWFRSPQRDKMWSMETGLYVTVKCLYIYLFY